MKKFLILLVALFGLCYAEVVKSQNEVWIVDLSDEVPEYLLDLTMSAYQLCKLTNPNAEIVYIFDVGDDGVLYQYTALTNVDGVSGWQLQIDGKESSNEEWVEAVYKAYNRAKDIDRPAPWLNSWLKFDVLD